MGHGAQTQPPVPGGRDHGDPEVRSYLTGGSQSQVPVSAGVPDAGHREDLAVLGLVQTGDDGPLQCVGERGAGLPEGLGDTHAGGLGL